MDSATERFHPKAAGAVANDWAVFFDSMTVKLHENVVV
jgi:hypothetical protein